MKLSKKRLLNIVYPLIAIAIVFFAWLIIAIVVDSEMIIPNPWEVIKNLFSIIFSNTFFVSVSKTLNRTIISFVIGLVIAMILSVTASLSPPLSKMYAPLIIIARATPTMSIILIAMVWLKSDFSPILTGFLISFPLLYSGIYSAINGIDSKLLEMAKIYKVNSWQIVKNIYYPMTAPYVFDSMASTLSLTLKVIIAGEVIAYTKDSIGINMFLSKIQIETAQLFAWTIIAIVLGYLLELLIKLLKLLFTRRKNENI